MEGGDMGTENYPTLYGKSSSGAIKQWEISVERKKDFSLIVVQHGQKGGKIQTSSQKVTEGKNIGRSNETNHFTQACMEAESKWKKQKDKNYVEDESELNGVLQILPMLAQKYNERKHEIIWPAYVQPKLNGVRCLVQRKGDQILYLSRKGKLYKNFNLYMDSQFLKLLKDGEILDGEMYNHGDLTFQELISAIKDEKTPDLDTLKNHVHFHCYDRVGDSGFEKRYLDWKYALPNGLHTPYLSLVTTLTIENEAELKAVHGVYVEKGYEGSIIRSNSNDPYCFQYRSNQLQKYKDFVDEEFKIVGCRDGKGKDEHKAIFRCQAATKTGGVYGDGTFDVRCKATMKEREDQWHDRKNIIGKMLTVRYQTLTDEGIPWFPVGIIVRDYE